MMAFSTLLKRTERIIADNSPAILTGIGVVGVLSTAYLTGHASIKAMRILDHEEKILVVAREPELTPKEKVQKVWKLYIPAVSTGLLTVTCIIAANRIGNRRAAAIAVAYSLTEKAFENKQEKLSIDYKRLSMNY